MQCSSLSQYCVRQVSLDWVRYARLPVRRQAACVSWFLRLISQEMTQRGFSICCVVSQPQINICQVLLDRLRCHNNLTSIANFIQWFKETCCLKSIWKQIFLIVSSFLLCLCVYTDINAEILSLISSNDAWLLFSCYLLFWWGLLFSEKQLVFLKAVRTVPWSRRSRKRFQFHLHLLSR